MVYQARQPFIYPSQITLNFINSISGRILTLDSAPFRVFSMCSRVFCQKLWIQKELFGISLLLWTQTRRLRHWTKATARIFLWNTSSAISGNSEYCWSSQWSYCSWRSCLSRYMVWRNPVEDLQTAEKREEEKLSNVFVILRSVSQLHSVSVESNWFLFWLSSFVDFE